MLGKLLKYDFKALFKFWWIAAASSIVLSILGGGSMAAATGNPDLPDAVMALFVIATVLSFLGLTAFLTLTLILIFVRYYKNFFSDEGYLTFTLPVSRFSLINSKLISSTCIFVLTILLYFVGICTILGIGLAPTEFWQDFIASLPELAQALADVNMVYFCLVILEILIFIVLLTVFSILTIFLCITFAAMIAKKAKVFAAIGIYYGINSVIGFLSQIFTLLCVNRISAYMLTVSDALYTPTILLMGLILIAFFAVLCLIIYTLTYWMLDRKLNLN